MKKIILSFYISFAYGSLIAPEDGSFLNHTHILFEWEQVPGALSYDLQISEDINFSSIVSEVTDFSLAYIEKNIFRVPHEERRREALPTRNCYGRFLTGKEFPATAEEFRDVSPGFQEKLGSASQRQDLLLLRYAFESVCHDCNKKIIQH